MSCDHRFKTDLMIEYADWDVHTLFIGTFNPCWESKNNYANWFYGRTSNNEFWCVLPKIYNSPSLLNGSKNNWIQFCKANKIGITDILQSLSDADQDNLDHQTRVNGFKDEELSKFKCITNEIPTILENYPNIKQICITRQTLPHFWKECFKETFK